MLSVYWACLAGGALFAVITVIFGDILGDVLDGMLDFMSVDGLEILQPMVLVGGITVFGGSGILLTKYTSLEGFIIVLVSVVLAIVMSMVVYFTYVKPMKNSENSTGFSLQELAGKIGEVTVAIPSKGYGEVMIKVGAGYTNQIAASLDGAAFSAGTKVVVAEVKESTLYVFGFDEE